MIRKLLIMIDYEEYLRKTQQDWDSRWENVQELITFASESESGTPPQPVPYEEGTPEASGKECAFHSLMDLAMSVCLYLIVFPVFPHDRDSKLRQFLQASMLSSEGDNESADESKEVCLT
jgi:DNA helicase-2/ATP-dependent DNA helicase PcrA